MKRFILFTLFVFALASVGEVIIKHYEDEDVLVADLATATSLAAKVDTADGTIKNSLLFYDSTGTNAVAKYTMETSGGTNTLSLYIWSISTTNWVLRNEWTEE